MVLFRRSIASLRRRDSRAGLISFGVIAIFGGVLGLVEGRSAAENVYREAKLRLVREARSVASDLGQGLDVRQADLRFAADVPAVAGHSPLQGLVYDAFIKRHPEFESVSVGTPTGVSKGHVQLVAELPGKTERAYGTFASGWPNRVVSSDHAFGQHAESATALIAPNGRQTTRSVRTPSWRVMNLHPQTLLVVRWSSGERAMVAKASVPQVDGSELPLLVLAMRSMNEISALRASALWNGLELGLGLGLAAGTAAWLAIARSTKRLRRVNVALERRVARRTARLEMAERSFRGIFENVPLGLYECDAKGRFLRVNPHLARTLGYADPGEMISALGSLQAVGDTGSRGVFLDRLRREGEVRTTTSALRVDGTPLWFAETARAVHRDGRVVIEGAMHDATAQHELEERLRRIGATDPLTGLLNRRGLEEAIEQAEAPVSIVMLDLDGFKAFNDTYGHPAGDAALQSVAQALRETVRGTDAVARAGGEEFVVVLPRTNAKGARQVAEALRNAVAARDILEARLTISGGVATARRTEDVGEALIAADRALYQAKQAGRNQIVANPAQMA